MSDFYDYSDDDPAETPKRLAKRLLKAFPGLDWDEYGAQGHGFTFAPGERDDVPFITLSTGDMRALLDAVGDTDEVARCTT